MNSFKLKNTIVLLFFVHSFFAQSPQFVWISGSDTAGSAGVYGTKGVPSPNTVPSGRWESVSWTDHSNNLWLFGGYFGNYDYSNDLWKYNIATNQWTWVSGSNTFNQPGNYGTKGVAASTNMPSARYRSATWVDNSGNLWLFGGWGYSGASYGYLNDLWKYDIAANVWTWISGNNSKDQNGTYGNQGQYYFSNVPGARAYAGTWTENDTLCLFGGVGMDAGGSSTRDLNDVWKYNIATNLWVWASGSPTGSQNGTYGIKGQPSVNNAPPSRSDANCWKDRNGNVWIYGGFNYFKGWLGDLWKYDKITNEWTWKSGTNTSNHYGSYGTQGVSSPSNEPSSREGSSSWANDYELWLFGGHGMGGSSSNGSLNDMWKYNILTNEWTWAGGSALLNQPSSFGVKGVLSPSNLPSGRYSSSYWKDLNNNFWLFGGSGYVASGQSGYLNDLWKIDASTVMGVKELPGSLLNTIQCYPNPNNGEFLLKSQKEISLNIINELGEIVESIELAADNHFTKTIRMANPGIYFVNSPGNNITKKIIITQ